jgi:hypothetical protein
MVRLRSVSSPRGRPLPSMLYQRCGIPRTSRCLKELVDPLTCGKWSVAAA